MIKYKCKMCGGSLAVKDGQKIVCCDYCGTSQPVPTFDDGKKASFYNRANDLRIRCEFDKAAGIYESLVAEYPKEAEAYWGLVLCKYGIEYVDDQSTGKKIPTCHRTIVSSIFDDVDFKRTVDCADVVAREFYQKEAEQIDALQKSILEISLKEEPFDIFICYKESDNDERTEDSLIANTIYNELSKLGYKVFLSRITLEKQLGSNYEPYIFAALQSSKLMIHVTTSIAHSESVWVKNEWARFLALINSGHNKSIITCYKSIAPKELPIELRHIQGQDIGKIGAMQDLIYGVQKIFHVEETSVNDSLEDKAIAEKYQKMVDRLYAKNEVLYSYVIEIEELIDFFESAGDYGDSKEHLRRAKYQFIKAVDSYDTCMQALTYIDELRGFEDVDALEAVVKQKALRFRTKELKEKGFAPWIVVDIHDEFTLCCAVESLVRCAQKDLSQLNDMDKQIIQECKSEVIDQIESNADSVINRYTTIPELKKIAAAFRALSLALPNENIVRYESVAQNRIDVLLNGLKTEARKKFLKRVYIITGVIVLAFIVILICVLSISASQKRKAESYSLQYFEVSIISKKNDTYNETLLDGQYGSGYFYTFKYNVKNNSSHSIKYLTGVMEIFNKYRESLATSEVSLSDVIPSNNVKTFNIQLNASKGDDAREIWNSDFDELEITFTIKSILFDDGASKHY